MARTEYNITCKIDGEVVHKTVEGYTFTDGTLKFGVTNRTFTGEVKDYWTITELHTGMSCAIGSTRKAAVNDALKDNIRKTVKNALETIYSEMEDVNPNVIIQTEYWRAK